MNIFCHGNFSWPAPTLVPGVFYYILTISILMKMRDSNQVENNEHVEVIEESAENIETLQAWTTNKLRGFKRVSPADTPSPNTTPPFPLDTSKPPHPSPRTPPTNVSTKVSAPPNATFAANNNSSEGEVEDRYRGKYCHYFVNAGKCRYEERSGEKCKFEHKTAPMCNFGTSCCRPKCMYTHPKVNGNRSNPFLGNTRSFNPVVNPWMVNPWMTMQPNQFQNQPWNHLQENQNNYQ